jgi:hypothetical protein
MYYVLLLNFRNSSIQKKKEKKEENFINCFSCILKAHYAYNVFISQMLFIFRYTLKFSISYSLAICLIHFFICCILAVCTVIQYFIWKSKYYFVYIYRYSLQVTCTKLALKSLFKCYKIHICPF